MRDQIDFQAVVDTLFLDRLIAFVESDDGLQWQQVNATQIEVGIGRRETVKMGSADRREQQRVRMRLDVLHHLVVVNRAGVAHGSVSSIARRRASTRNALARS